MSRLRLVFGTALVFALLLPASAAVFPSLTLFQSATLVSGNGSGMAICSGTFLQEDVILTAAHCLVGVTSLHAYVAGGDEVLGKPLYVSVVRDLALVKLARAAKGVSPAVLSTDVNVGQEVWLVGAPDFEPLMVFHGYISKIKVEGFQNPCSKGDKIGTQPQQLLLLDARVWNGISGGGVFNEHGALVGVEVRMATESEGTGCSARGGLTVLWGYAVGPTAVMQFLDESKFSNRPIPDEPVKPRGEGDATPRLIPPPPVTP